MILIKTLLEKILPLRAHFAMIFSFFFFYRQKHVLRSAKKRGRTQCIQAAYTKKTTQAPEKKEET